MDTAKSREEVYFTWWKDPTVTEWVEKNFKGEARESVYAALLWVADRWPEMRDKMGIVTDKVSDKVSG